MLAQIDMTRHDPTRFTSREHSDIRVALVQPLIPDGNYLPNLGIMYMAAVLLREGFSVEVMDENIHGNIEEALVAFQPHVIGFTCVTAAVPAVSEFATRLKSRMPDVKTLVGGPHVSVRPLETLRDFAGFDYGFVGECEAHIVALCRDMARDQLDVEHTPGLVYRDADAEVHKNPQGRFLSGPELDDLPFPAWHLIDMERVFERATHGLFSKGKRIMPVMTTRGCPNYCGFCARVMGFELRSRSIETVAAEIQWLFDTYAIDELYFEDDTFTQDMDRAEALLGAVIELGLPIYVKFANGLRADKVSRSLLQLMKDAGVYWVGFGIESGAPATQELMHKNLDLDQARANVMLARDMGFKVGSNCIIGYPGETRADVKQSVEYFLGLELDSMAIVSCVPFPGTTVWQVCKKNGWLTPMADDYSNYWFEIMRVNPLISTPMLSGKDMSRAISTTYVRFYLTNPRRAARVARMLLKVKRAEFRRTVRQLRANISSPTGWRDELQRRSA